MPARSYRYYVLAIMATVYTMNFADRYLFGVMLQSIKLDLKLSDTQLGFLSGIAFAVFYVFLGLPIARWADRGNRVTIASLAIGLWGVMVMASSLVVSFTQLALARMGAAIGEAGCTPPTYSLVGDYFDDAERTRALSIYMLGGPLSGLAGLALGGWLNDLYGWRTALLLAGLPGIVISMLIRLTIREPRAGHAASPLPPQPPLGAVFNRLWSKSSLRHLTASMTLLAIVAIGFMPWYAAFMIRSHGMSSSEVGIWLGAILCGGGMFGTLLGGFFADRYMSGREDMQMRISGVAVALIFPFTALFLLAPDKYVALGAFVPMIILFHVFLGPIYALLQRLVLPSMRATALATVMMVINLIAMGLGPQVVGILSDLGAPRFGGDALRYAMLLVSLASVWAGWHFWCVGDSVMRELAESEMKPQG